MYKTKNIKLSKKQLKEGMDAVVSSDGIAHDIKKKCWLEESNPLFFMTITVATDHGYKRCSECAGGVIQKYLGVMIPKE